MAESSGKSGLLERLGAKAIAAHEKAKNNEVVIRAELPSGIKKGLCRLKTAKWDEYKDGDNKGEPYVLLRAVAITPEVHPHTTKGADGKLQTVNIKVAGQGVMLMIPLCDVPAKGKRKFKSFDENYAELLNELGKFLNVKNMAETQPGDVEAILQHLEKEQPYSWYSTRGWTPDPTVEQPNPTEMIFISFDGQCDPPIEGPPVEQALSGMTGSSDHHLATGPAESADTFPTSGEQTSTQVEEVTVDMTVIIALADDNTGSDESKQAAKYIQDMCIAAGFTKEQVEKAGDLWADAAKLLEPALVQAPPPPPVVIPPVVPPAAVQPWKPSKGRVAHYKVINLRTGKPLADPTGKELKPKECTMEAVYTNGTCDLKQLDDPKIIYKGVKVADLEEAKAK